MHQHVIDQLMRIVYEQEAASSTVRSDYDDISCDLPDTTARSDYYITLLFVLACLVFVIWCGMEFRTAASDVSIIDPLLAVFFTASGIAKVLYENKRHEGLPRHQLMHYFTEFIVSEYCTIFFCFLLTYVVYLYKRHRLSIRGKLQLVNLIRLLSRRVLFYITATIYNLNIYTFSIITPLNKSVILLCAYLGLYILLILALSEILDGTVDIFSEFSPESLIISVGVLVIHYGYTYINYFHTFNVSVITFSVCMYLVSRILLYSP
uniref:Protein E13 n=1 Tax=Elephant endotheliotropic herpesvirus 1A TaxID=759753 RepID=A0A866VU86_ELHV1|nr:protein E13 [Elephant endotheliotropic herpesvirus 1A]